jgi:hypothetical protein
MGGATVKVHRCAAATTSWSASICAENGRQFLEVEFRSRVEGTSVATQPPTSGDLSITSSMTAFEARRNTNVNTECSHEDMGHG